MLKKKRIFLLIPIIIAAVLAVIGIVKFNVKPTDTGLTSENIKYIQSLDTGRTAKESFKLADETQKQTVPTVGEVVKNNGIMSQTVSDVIIQGNDGKARIGNIQVVASDKDDENKFRDSVQEIAGIGNDGSYGNSVLIIEKDLSRIKTQKPLPEKKNILDGVFTKNVFAASNAHYGDTVIIQKGPKDWFNSHDESWGYTHDYSLPDGTTAYCINATLPTRPGAKRVRAEYGYSSSLAKVAYYAPGGPGYKSSLWAGSGCPNDYVAAHLLLSYLYRNEWSGYETRTERNNLPTVLRRILSQSNPPESWSFCVAYNNDGKQQYGFGSMKPQGKFRAQKISSNTNATVNGQYRSYYSYSGAKYVVKNSSGTIVARLTIQSNGYSEYTPLLSNGRYSIKEEGSAPKGYKVDGNTYYVNVNGQTGGFTTNVTENYYRHGNVRVKKLDKGTGAKLTDAEFALDEWNGSSYQYKSTIKDGNNDGVYETGVLAETDKNKGWFRIRETKAPENHDIPSDWKSGKEFQLNSDNSDLSFNDENTGHFTVSILKKDENGNVLTTSTDGTFVLYGMNRNGSYKKIGNLTYDEASQRYVIKNVEITKDTGGKFRITEEKAPTGYMASSGAGASVTFNVPGDIRKGTSINLDGADNARATVEENGTFTIQMVNKEVEPVGQIRLKKTDVKTNKAIEHGKAVFRIYSYDTSTGKYDKTAVDHMEYDSATGTYYTKVNWNDGSQGMTPKNGQATAKSGDLTYLNLDRDKKAPGYLNEGKYKLVEISAADGYVNDGYSEEIQLNWIDDTKNRENVQVFNLPTNKGTAKAFRRLNTAGTLGNMPNSFIIHKENDAGTPLANVYFFIGKSKEDRDYLTWWGTNGSSVVQRTPEVVNGAHLYKTDASGNITLERIPEGTYWYQERTNQNAGYAPDASDYPYYNANGIWHSFVVKTDGTIVKTEGGSDTDSADSVTRTIKNHHKIKVNVTKNAVGAGGSNASNDMNFNEKETFPSGTEFEIYEWSKSANKYKTAPYIKMNYDSTKKQFVDRTTNELPEVVWLTDNEGKFQIKETRQTNGYIIDKTPKEITVPRTPAAGESPIAVSFDNTPNSIQIKKTSSKNGAALSGAEFMVWKNTAKRGGKTFTTDANGLTPVIYGLAPGVWKYQETKAPAGYDLDDSVESFVVNTDGTIGDKKLTFSQFVAEDTMTSHADIHKKDSRTGEEYDIDGSSFPDGTEFDIYEWDQSLNGGKGGYSETPKRHVVVGEKS